MAEIKGAEGLTVGDVFREIGEGATFVVYQHCVSIGIASFKNPSAIYFVRPGQRHWGPALSRSAVSLVCGWWGIPWGPIWTVSTIGTNLAGGKDVTEGVMHWLSQYPADARMAGNAATAQLEQVFD